jgi:hypothetical protein
MVDNSQEQARQMGANAEMLIDAERTKDFFRVKLRNFRLEKALLEFAKGIIKLLLHRILLGFLKTAESSLDIQGTFCLTTCNLYYPYYLYLAIASSISSSFTLAPACRY